MSRYEDPATLPAIIGEIHRRLGALERTRTIQVGSGAPTAAASDGAQYGDKTNLFYYLRLNGAWKKVAVS
jgi:hypothetical protein